MTEMSEERDALNLARSRFENAREAFRIAREQREEAQELYMFAWVNYERAADDLAAANRRILHTIASGGQS